MSWRTKIARWVDPDAYADREDDAEEIKELQIRAAELAGDLVNSEEQVSDLQARLATCAANNLNAKGVNAELRKALNGAIAYVIDHVDDLQQQLDELGPKSRKRVALEATLGAVKYDLDRFRKVAVIVTEVGK